MPTLEILERDTWEDVVNAPLAFLMIGKSDCAACNTWTDELKGFLEAEGAAFEDVRFGKVLLDTPGLGKFKKANPWLADVHDLPYNLVLVNGERMKEWVGGGAERMANRLRRFR